MKQPFTLKTRLFIWLWFAYSAYMAVQYYVMRWRLGGEVTWIEAVGSEFTYGGLWLLFTPLILWMARRVPFRKSNWPAALGIHFCAGVVLAVAQAWIYTLVFSVFRLITAGTPLELESQITSMASFFDYGIHLYWLVLALDYVYEYYFITRRHELNEARLEAQLAEARLQALTMQIRPHFLFNTLNTISVLIRSDPDVARRMVGHVSALLRQTLSVTDEGEITLQRELEFLRNYLEIEKTRFNDRLTLRYEIAPDTLEALLPAMILQPLVENSVKHGVSRTGGNGIITISAVRLNGRLRVAVANTGHGFDGAAPPEGVGLSNTRSRLRHLYGDEQEFRLAQNTIGGVDVVTAEVLLPWHTDTGET